LGPEILGIGSNLKKLMDLSGDWIDKVHQRKPPKRLIRDMDSSVSETYGSKKARPTTGTSVVPVITIPDLCSGGGSLWLRPGTLDG